MLWLAFLAMGFRCLGLSLAMGMWRGLLLLPLIGGLARAMAEGPSSLALSMGRGSMVLVLLSMGVRMSMPLSVEVRKGLLALSYEEVRRMKLTLVMRLRRMLRSSFSMRPGLDRRRLLAWMKRLSSRRMIKTIKSRLEME
jgi:hypothetical protein